MSPQLYFLLRLGLLNALQTLIQQNLSNTFLTSHQIDQLISHSPLKQQLCIALAPYSPSGFKEPSSFVGAICADLANSGSIRRSMAFCPITNSVRPAFSL